jgi:ABC-type branched-subunit amino acid transport system substrate-binding protein
LTLTSAEVKGERAASSLFAWTIAARGEGNVTGKNFAPRYRRQTGRPPSAAAVEAYDAVCLTVQALRAAGPNRARVRDQLARTRNYSGASGSVSFDHQGNNTTEIHLVEMRLQPSSTERGASAE